MLHCLQHIDGRFDGIHEHIDALKTHLGQSNSNAIPGLHPVIQAEFDHFKSGRSSCEPNTRLEALATIYSWICPGHPILSQLPPPVIAVRHEDLIMWIYALAGSGKSTLSHTTAEWCDGEHSLAASFFCAQDGDRSNVQAIIPTIAYQLSKRCPLFREALCEVVAKISSVHELSVASQLKKLIVEPLGSAIAQGSRAFHGCVVIIDALDECKDDDAVSVVLSSLSLHVSSLGPLRFLITSRPVNSIEAGFNLPGLARNTRRFALSSIPEEHTARDIRLFLQNRLREVAARYPGLGPDWPPAEQFEQLVILTESLFIFASTSVLFIGDEAAQDPADRLSDLLRSGNAAAEIGTRSKSPFRILDALYLQVLMSRMKRLGPTPFSRLKLILGAIVVAEERLGPATLEGLLSLPSGTARRLLSLLNAILVLPSPGQEYSPIRLIHLSFADFVIDSSRCTEPAYLINPLIQHTLLAEHCLRVLLTLRHNICEVEPKYDRLLNCEIPDLPEKIARHLPPWCQYACKHWFYHLLHAQVDQQILDALHAFCDDHLLDWLEALSLLGCVDVAIEALQSVQRHLQVLPLPPTDIPALLYDCERIVRAFYEGISASFFEVLRATATFGPLNSLLRRRHAANFPHMIQLRYGRELSWSATLTSTDTAGSYIACLGFSPDGKLLACGAGDGTLRLRNVHTGADVHIVDAHAGRTVRSVSFSPDGKSILSGSDDGTVELWNVATGARLGTWKRHSGSVRSLVWSTDGVLAASACYDLACNRREEAVILWSTASPEETVALSDHRGWIRDIVFAADGTLLSGSDDKTCKIWDTRTASVVRTLEHESDVLSVAISTDGRLIACGLYRGAVVIWDNSNGAMLHTLRHADSDVISLAFYANDTLAAGYLDSSLSLWDVNSGTPSKLLPGSHVYSQAASFSTDGMHIAISVSNIVYIKQWPAVANSDFPGSSTLGGADGNGDSSALCSRAPTNRIDDFHGDVLLFSVSPDGRFVATIYSDKVGLLEVGSGIWKQGLKHKSAKPFPPTAWSPSSNLVAWKETYRICVWDTKPGGCIRGFLSHSSWFVTALAFTPDEQRIVSGSMFNGTIRSWDPLGHPESSNRGGSLFQGDCAIHALAISFDGKWMISGSSDTHPPNTSGIDLLAKPSREPSVCHANRYQTLRLHDATGRILWIEHTTCSISSLAFSDDCTRALVGFSDGRISLYDISQLIDVAENRVSTQSTSDTVPAVPEYEFTTGSSEGVKHIAFSPDGRGIITEGNYTPLQVEQRPRSSVIVDPSLPPAYFLSDGWLWRSTPEAGCRRVCWVPPTFRPSERFMEGSWSVRGHTIACKTPHNRLVVLDASPCS
ncbi:WD40 repeat-like protein [Trametes sanguinea]|nr:WD40 repeat-like protein [Trametes sanguinea]